MSRPMRFSLTMASKRNAHISTPDERLPYCVMCCLLGYDTRRICKIFQIAPSLVRFMAKETGYWCRSSKNGRRRGPTS